MYGFIHCCLQDLVVKQFGKETWNTILKESGVTVEGDYVIHRVYSDEETMKLVTTTQQLSGIPLNDILETFGDHFYHYCVDSGYDRILRILGRTLHEFLCNLDALHDHLACIYPGMSAPSFRTTKRTDGGMDLHYYSTRKGLGPIVIGIMKTVARECLHTEVDIEIDRVEEDGHTVFAVREKNKIITPATSPSSFVYTPNSQPSSTLPSITNSIMMLFKRKKQFMSVKSFSEAFPFHVVFDRDLNIRQCGSSISKYVDIQGYSIKKNKKVIYSSFSDTFRLMRPKLNFTFENVLNHINTVFVVTSKRRLELPKKSVASNPGTPNFQVSKVRDALKYSALFTAAAMSTSLCTSTHAMSKPQIAQELKLKGQMIYLPQTNCILFLCTPRVRTLEELERRGLYLSDIPLHDATREIILATKEHAEDRRLMKKVEDFNNGLKILQQKLVYNKQVTDELLHELIPPNVARQLRLNLPVLAESYEVVTILFSDLVGFTALCSNESVVPMDIIKLLNKLYSMFDSISSMYKIYKVETIGDAYMGVCGIPTYIDDHAEKIARMGMDMLDCVKNVKSPVDSHPVRIRVGLHSGSCMAGVVGKKTPRYCLFGRTVTIANKMESGSSPGKLNISFETRKYLDDASWNFRVNPNENPVECFFLEKSESHQERDAHRSVLLRDLVTETNLKSESPGSTRKEFPTFANNNNNNIDPDINADVNSIPENSGIDELSNLSGASSTLSDNLESFTLSTINYQNRNGHAKCPFSMNTVMKNS